MNIKYSKSALETELQGSAIAPDLATNFIPVKSIDEAIHEVDETPWDYLFYLDVYRKNDGGLRLQWLKNYKHIDGGGWWCPTLDIIEGERSNWGCFKPKTPRRNKEGKVVKYEHPPRQPVQPFFLEVTRKRWEWLGYKNLANGSVHVGVPENCIPLEFWEWVKRSPDLPIIITEGAKKTASLLSANYCAVGISGVWNGCPAELADDGTKLEKKLNPQLEAIATPGREFIFAFDNDTKPKTVAAVSKALQTLGGLFEDEGCTVSVMTWRHLEEKGIDDVHLVRGVETVDEIFENRRSLEDWQKDMRKPILKPKAKENLALLEEDKKQKVEVITTTPLAPVSEYDPALDPEANSKAHEQERDPSLTFQEIALRWIYGKGDYISIQHTPQKFVLYKFNGKYYEPQKPSWERKKIKAWASQYWVKDPKSGRKSYRYLSTSAINEIYKYTLMSFEVEKDECNPEGLNLNNGTLKIYWVGNTPHWQLEPHSPKHYYLSCSPVSYDSQADPSYCNQLLECLDPLPRQILLRNIAAMFDVQKIRSLHSRPTRAGLCVGSGANGKDSLRNTLSLIIEGSLVSIGLSDFVQYDRGDRNGLKELDFARVNWSTENNQETPLDKIEILNALVTGEKDVLWISDKYMPAERKNSDAIHLFNCNNMPIIKSGLKSLESRFVIYNFEKTYTDNPDPNKGELQADPRFHGDRQFQIEKVAPALLNRLLHEFVALAREGIDYSGLSKGLKTLQQNSTHLWTFVEDSRLVADKDGRVWVSDLWRTLEKWYIDNGTLEAQELYDGSIRRHWNDQPIRFDKNITGANQIFKRFQKLFPNISKDREKRDPAFKGQTYIKGISLQSASLLHSPCKSSTSASPSASLSFTTPVSPSPEPIPTTPSLFSPSEAKSEASREAETIGSEGSEAVKQNQQNSKTKKKLPPVPYELAMQGYLFSIGQELWFGSQKVEVAAYPPNLQEREARKYRCIYKGANAEVNLSIPQSDLREVRR